MSEKITEEKFAETAVEIFTRMIFYEQWENSKTKHSFYEYIMYDLGKVAQPLEVNLDIIDALSPLILTSNIEDFYREVMYIVSSDADPLYVRRRTVQLASFLALNFENIIAEVESTSGQIRIGINDKATSLDLQKDFYEDLKLYNPEEYTKNTEYKEKTILN